MEMLKRTLVVSLLVILIICNMSLARTKMLNQKSTYIVHVAKFQMPTTFDHHSVWYESTLKSVSNSAEMLYTYDNAIHGFSTSLTAEEAQLLKNQTGILKVLPDKTYKLLTTRTPEFLGLDKITDMFPASNQSNDVIVGLLDTGIWPESKSFDDTGYGPIPSRWKGKCQTGTNFKTSNCNKKLIGARFYNKGFVASLGLINEKDDSISPRDDAGHGTHTASTVVGSPVVNASLFGYAAGTARGMATGARVAMYKVCWLEACAVSDILGAMDQAIVDGVDVLSISLGGDPVDYVEDNLAIGAFAAMEHGIIVSCAGGNSGPNSSTITNLAPWITTVGAGTLDRDFPSDVILGNGQNYSGVSLYAGDTLPDSPIPFVYAGNASDVPGIFSTQCLFGTLAKEKARGKIVLCDRGVISRTQKGYEVKRVGGLGMVLVNLVADGEEPVADAHVLPATSVGFTDGEAIKKYMFSNSKPTATLLFRGTKVGIQPSPVVADFSSRGPNSITPQILKPDLIAPGVNILAAYSKNASPSNLESDHRRVDFNIISGTSMACPHVSGLAALIKSIHPDWSPAAIRSALITTAYTTYKSGKALLDGATKKPAMPFDLGAGHVDPVHALNPGLVYDLTVDDYLSFLCALNYSAKNIEVVARRKYQCDSNKHYSVTNLNYPSFAVVLDQRAMKVNYTRTLTNVGAAGTYKVSVKTDSPSVKISVEPEELNFMEHEKKSYVVTFTTSGPVQITQSFGSLEWSNGKTIVRSPIAFTWKNVF